MFFKVPGTVKEASMIKKDNILVSCLKFLAVMVVGSVLQSVLILIPVAIKLISEGKGDEVAATMSDTEKLTSVMYSSDLMMVFTLLSTIALIIITILYCKKVEERPLTSMGFRRKGCVKEYFKGLLVGFILMSVVVGIELLTGSLKITGVGDFSFIAILLLLGMMIGFFIQSAEEEIMLRGYFLTTLGVHNKIPVAIIVSSIMFSLIHVFNGSFSFLPFLNITLIGAFLALYYIQTDNIWGVAAIHGIWNYSQGNIYGITVSGIISGNSFLMSEQVKGQELLNGGSFGAEGGIVATIVVTIAIILMLVYMYKKGTLVKRSKVTS
mgnify:CR=1 FL=1